VHEVPESQDCPACYAIYQTELDAEAAERQRIAELNAKWKADRERRQEAEMLAKASGGVEKWYGCMSVQDHQRWDDLRQTLVDAERLHKESEASWQRANIMAPKPAPVVGHTAPAWVPPIAPTGIIEVDYPPDSNDQPNMKARITSRYEPRPRTPSRDDGPAGFD
jgi:hypothetical protein